jgi:AAA family ATP:ADP antiporter
MELDERDDDASVLYATVAAGFILLQQIGAKTARDALFLTNFPARDLPKVMAAAAGISLLVVLASARAMGRLGPRRFLPIALIVNALLFGAEALSSTRAPGPVALLLYLHVAALGSVLVSGFWSLVTERFDPHKARKYMGRIGIGATLGGAAGGLAADGAMRLVSTPGLLALLGATSLVAAVSALKVGRSKRAPASVLGGSPPGALGILRTTPYLTLLGGLAALAALWAALLDYAFKAEVSVAVRDPAELVRFFGWFYTATGILTFLFQAVFGDRLLRKHGIGVTVGVLPAFVAGFAVVTGLVDLFAVLVLLRTVESVLANSLHRASYELFFTPLPQVTKRPTKTIVDVAATRVGDALGSGLVLGALALVPDLPARGPVLGAAAAAVIALLLVGRLHRGYVEALTGALRQGKIKLDEQSDQLDALTHRTLAESTHLVDRERLLEEIEAFRRDRDDEGAARTKHPTLKNRTLGSATASSGSSIEARFAATLDPIVSTALILISKDNERIKRVLERPVDARLTPFVVSLLGAKAVAKEAESALAVLGGRIVGQLTDALHDAALSRSARARVARLLGGVSSPRALEGLFEGLGLSPSGLRVECARSIARQLHSREVTDAERDRIYAAVAAALEQPDDRLDVNPSLPPPADGPPAEPDIAERLEPRVQVALALLSAAIDKETVELATRALVAGDPVLRGTALEYLENVLQEPAKTALLKTLSAAPIRVTKKRSERELLEELRRSRG